MKIRKAAVSDLNIINTIERQAFMLDYYSFTEIESLLLQNDSVNFILEIDGKAVGYILSVLFLHEATILKIAIEKEYQGRGYGKQLLNYYINYLKNEKAEKIFIEVSDKNIKAKELYLSCGFQITRTRKQYYKDNSDALEVVKVIN